MGKKWNKLKIYYGFMLNRKIHSRFFFRNFSSICCLTLLDAGIARMQNENDDDKNACVHVNAKAKRMNVMIKSNEERNTKWRRKSLMRNKWTIDEQCVYKRRWIFITTKDQKKQLDVDAEDWLTEELFFLLRSLDFYAFDLRQMATAILQELDFGWSRENAILCVAINKRNSESMPWTFTLFSTIRNACRKEHRGHSFIFLLRSVNSSSFRVSLKTKAKIVQTRRIENRQQ